MGTGAANVSEFGVLDAKESGSLRWRLVFDLRQERFDSGRTSTGKHRTSNAELRTPKSSRLAATTTHYINHPFEVILSLWPLLAAVHLHPTDFQPVLTIAGVMTGFTRPWAFAGGWSVDLFAGRLTRTHYDVEIAILRDHQMELRDYLREWKFSFVIGGKSIRWVDRQMLMLPIHEVHAQNPIGLKLEILLNESDGIDWIYRRESRIRLNLSKWIRRNAEGIPSLAPEIVLLYKSKKPRPQDELDLRSIVGLMSSEQRAWLIEALIKIDPAHEWIGICRSPESMGD